MDSAAAEIEIILPTEYVRFEDGDALALTVPEDRALAFFTTEGAVDPVLAEIRKKIEGFSADVNTAKGRKQIAAMARRVASSKTYLEEVGKELAAAQKRIPKLIDESRKKIRDTLDALRDEVRAPLTKWEKAEEARIGAHKARIAKIESIGAWAARDQSTLASALRKDLEDIEAVVIGPGCEEFAAEYATAKDGARALLTVAIAAAEKREAEQAELARLRQKKAESEARERDERIAREAAERARQEAERKAAEEIASREAAARAEKEAIEAKARAERDEAERREREAALKAEEERLAAERREMDLRRHAEEAEKRARDAEARAKREAEEAKAREAAEAAAREADREHRAKINNAALDAFVEFGLSPDSAKMAVTLIAQRVIPNVSISY
jgi:colicin import membrane protein